MGRKSVIRLAQSAVAIVVVAFVIRVLVRNWATFQSLDFELRWQPGSIAAAALATFGTYALQVASWQRVLAGWEQRLSYGKAARIWFVANLGRYVPGKVWSVTGLVVLAQRAGVAAWAAAASAVAVQALGLGTAVALVAATAPAAAASPLRLAAAAAVAAATLGLLAWPVAADRVSRWFQPATPWRALPVGRTLEAAALTLAGWATYGLAFWLLARGIGIAGLAPTTAAGVFALGYILGLVALFAPGGIGVREAAFVTLLAPHIGPGPAVALSVASRILLTLTEIGAALAALVAEKRTQGGLG